MHPFHYKRSPEPTHDWSSSSSWPSSSADAISCRTRSSTAATSSAVAFTTLTAVSRMWLSTWGRGSTTRECSAWLQRAAAVRHCCEYKCQPAALAYRHEQAVAAGLGDDAHLTVAPAVCMRLLTLSALPASSSAAARSSATCSLACSTVDLRQARQGKRRSQKVAPYDERARQQVRQGRHEAKGGNSWPTHCSTAGARAGLARYEHQQADSLLLTGCGSGCWAPPPAETPRTGLQGGGAGNSQQAQDMLAERHTPGQPSCQCNGSSC